MAYSDPPGPQSVRNDNIININSSNNTTATETRTKMENKYSIKARTKAEIKNGFSNRGIGIFFNSTNSLIFILCLQSCAYFQSVAASPAVSSTPASQSYALPKFVVPLHQILWTKENPKPVKNLKLVNNKTESTISAVRKSIAQRDVNFVESVDGKPGEGFYIALDIGTPPQRMNVLIDTGSSNFAIAGRREPDVNVYFDRTKSSTLRDLWRRVTLKYTQGEWEGDLVSDLVSLATSSAYAQSRASFTLITSSTKFFLKHAKWQGILGLAYPGLSRPDRSEPTFVDLVVRDNRLKNVFALQLCGDKLIDFSASSGHLAIGGVDPRAFTGNMYYTPIEREMYYEVVVADMDVGGKPLGVPCGVFNSRRTIVDSGTTNVLLPASAFNALVFALKKATTSAFHLPIPSGFWNRRQLICVADGAIDFAAFPVVGISLFANENHAFRLQLRPEQYLRVVGEYGFGGNCYKLSIGPSGDAGTVLGAVLMEGFYVVFDKAGKRIGWAQNNCRDSSENAITSTLSPPSAVAVNITYCRSPTKFQFFNDDYDTNQRLMIASYVLGGIAIFLLGLVIFLLVEPILFKRKRFNEDNSNSNNINDNGKSKNPGDYEQLE